MRSSPKESEKDNLQVCKQTPFVSNRREVPQKMTRASFVEANTFGDWPPKGSIKSDMSHHSPSLGGCAPACKSGPTELAPTQTAAWPRVRAGVASGLNYAPD